MEDVTICSVYHSPLARAFLELNRDLVEKMNPGAKWRWLAVDNSPAAAPLLLDAAKFDTLKGLQHSFLEHIFVRPIVSTYHHSIALNQMRTEIRTRFAVFLDIDFFVVRKNWIRDVVSHMKKEKVAFFGCTWHPKYYGKYRYAPAHHFFVVDTHAVPAPTLDFTPKYLSNNMFVWANPDGTFPAKGETLPAKNTVQRIWRNIRNRMDIATSRDTGYCIYQMTRGGRVKHDTVTSVYKRKGPDKKTLAGLASALFEAMLPDRWSYIPKKKGYYAREGFKEKGRYDFDAKDMEEMMWKGEPFAVHVRHTWKKNEMEQELAILRGELFNFVEPLPA